MAPEAKRILIISYYFPPRPGVASLRLQGLAKYLPEFGWNPVILTAQLPDAPDPRYDVVETPYPGDVPGVWKARLGIRSDKTMREQSETQGFKSKRNLVSRVVRRIAYDIFAFPDRQKYWLKPAVDAGEQLFESRTFEAVVSSSGPSTSHLIAAELKRRYHIPWIADFRDLWSQNHNHRLGVIRRARHRRLELRTLRLADAAVTVSEPLSEKLRSLHKGLSVHTITNGYDPDDVVELPLTEQLTITYTGSLYDRGQDPELLFSVLHNLLRAGFMRAQDVRVRFYGPIKHWLRRLVERYGLGEVVSITPPIARAEALNRQRESQVLLLLNWVDPRERGIYTGKLFEYLAARRPILAIGGPGGVVQQLLQETGAGVHVGTETELTRVLLEYYEQYRVHGSVLYHGNADKIALYSHREMARRFGKLLDEIVGTRCET